MRDDWEDREPLWAPAIIFGVLFALSLWLLLAVTP